MKAEATIQKGREAIMELLKIRRAAQITLPAEVRKALKVKEGDFLAAEMVEGGVLLKPVTVTDREAAWEKVFAAMGQVEWVGPGPEPTDEDEIMQEAVEAVREVRRERAQSRR